MSFNPKHVSTLRVTLRVSHAESAQNKADVAVVADVAHAAKHL